ncbi:hypothetical protein [Streptomyces sp. NPDC127084]|uniref:hypothetical protein n=1 Tax=Streptomyces sp. NPDC127084 TaxID=3347133 RepID=UPI00364DAA37
MRPWKAEAPGATGAPAADCDETVRDGDEERIKRLDREITAPDPNEPELLTSADDRFVSVILSALVHLVATSEKPQIYA